MAKIAKDRRPRLGDDVVSFEDMCEHVSYSEYEHQMYITDQHGGDRILGRWLELVELATKMMVGGELYDGKPWVDFSEEELM